MVGRVVVSGLKLIGHGNPDNNLGYLIYTLFPN
jgi:hypothetical protein